MGQDLPRVFLSGTRSDLADYWPVSIEVCRQLGLFPVDMDAFPAMPVDGAEGSRQILESCDLYVGVVAHRFGPVTEVEFDHAGEIGVDRLCFLIDPEAEWPGKGESKRPDRLQAFKAKIADTVIYTTFHDLESYRAELTKSLQEWLARPAQPLRQLLLSGKLDLPARPTPGKLLTAAYEVIPFEKEARLSELERLTTWCDDPAAASVWLITGPGGAGKTRLMIEGCRGLRQRGWAAGFLRSGATGKDLEPFFQPGPPRLVVLDYAETRLELLRMLLTRLAEREAAKPLARVVLLARAAGDWWTQLFQLGEAAEDLLLASPPPLEIEPLVVREVDRPAAFLRAVEAFSQKIDSPRPTPIPRPDFSEPIYDRALYLHMAALSAAWGEAVRHGQDAIRRTVQHERRFWRREAAELAGDQVALREVLEEVFERCVAALTLAGGIEAGDDFLSPWLGRLDSTTRQRMPERLLRLYRGAAGRLEPLQPDLLGEELVRQVLTTDPGLLDLVLDSASDPGATHALTTLTRLAEDHEVSADPWLDQALSGRLERLALPALEVVVQTGEALAPVLLRRLQAAGDHSVAKKVMDRCNKQDLRISVRLREVALWSTETCVAAHRARKASPPRQEWLAEMASLLSSVGTKRSLLGMWEIALDATLEAVEIRRRLVKERPGAHLPGLAVSLNSLGIRQAEVGNREAALEATLEAVEIRRQLAEEQPDIHLPNLAISLDNLGIRQNELGKLKAALSSTEQAIGIFRHLAESQPDTFLPSLAKSLNSLGNRQSRLGQLEAALHSNKEAEEIYRRLAEERPDAFLPNLALSLNNLGIRQLDLGKREEALVSAEAAAETYRRLAEARPGAFLPDLAMSLLNLGAAQSSMRKEKALRSTEEASEIYGRLAEKSPDTFLPDLALSLSNLGAIQVKRGDRKAALRLTEQAVSIRRRLAEAHPDAFLPDLATSLSNLGKMLSAEQDDLIAALAASEEAVRLMVPVFLQLPGAYGDLMVSVLRNYFENAKTLATQPDLELLKPVASALRHLQENNARQGLAKLELPPAVSSWLQP